MNENELAVEKEETRVLYEALVRLEKNKDFQLLIMTKYLKDSVLDNVSLLAHPLIKKRGERPDVMEELIAKSNLGIFLDSIKTMGAELEEEDNTPISE